MTRRAVTTAQTSVDTCIDGNGPAAVIVPSYGRDAGSDVDASVTALVAAGYRVLRPQPRGIEGSGGPMRGVTFADAADDAARVIDDLAEGPAVIPGHAFGNYVARAAAVHHPDKVAAVILGLQPGNPLTHG